MTNLLDRWCVSLLNEEEAVKVVEEQEFKCVGVAMQLENEALGFSSESDEWCPRKNECTILVSAFYKYEILDNGFSSKKKNYWIMDRYIISGGWKGQSNHS